VNAIGFASQRAFSCRRLAGQRALGKRALHALDRPEQVHRGRPRRRQQLAVLLELGRELLGAGRLAARRAERQPMAAHTPIAGAPRITMFLIALATSLTSCR
jgi:hypothetical protein